MGVSPVDMQVMITKTTEIASKHSAELHKATTDQQRVSEKETLRQEENTKKVHDRNTAEKIYVDEEEEKERKKKEEKKKLLSEDEEYNDEGEVEVPEEDNIGRHFDASI